jgi:hypothetical protein
MDADNAEELIKRIEDWENQETEGVLAISPQPEVVEIPPSLQPPPPPVPPSMRPQLEQ